MKSLRADKVKARALERQTIAEMLQYAGDAWVVMMEHRHALSTSADVKKLIRQEGLIARPEFGTKNAKGEVTSIYAD